MKEIEITEKMIEGAVSIEKTRSSLKPWRIDYKRFKLFSPSMSDRFLMRVCTASGVRLFFKTDSENIVLKVHTSGEDEDKSIFDLTIDGKFISSFKQKNPKEDVKFLGLPGGKKNIEIWLPQFRVVNLKKILIDKKAKLTSIKDTRVRWITYGSSITHCRGAKSPAFTWPSIVARRYHFNLTSLGFGGECHLDPMIARVIRDLKADFISLKVGINIYGSNSLSPRTFQPALIGFISTIREKHKNVPIAVISPIVSPPREKKENNVGFTLEKMRQEIKEVVSIFRKYGDKNIYYFSGLDLFNNKYLKYLPDNLHPDAEGYMILGENFSKRVVKKLIKYIVR